MSPSKLWTGLRRSCEVALTCASRLDEAHQAPQGRGIGCMG